MASNQDLNTAGMSCKRQLFFTKDVLDDAAKRICEGESKRSVAKSLGVNEATLRKRLKSVSFFHYFYNFGAFQCISILFESIYRITYPIH